VKRIQSNEYFDAVQGVILSTTKRLPECISSF